jgi:hypothetical protein
MKDDFPTPLGPTSESEPDNGAWAESSAGQRELRGEVAAYRASVRALLDLVRVGWRLDVDRGTLELLPPIRLRSRLLPEQVRACKDERSLGLLGVALNALDYVGSEALKSAPHHHLLNRSDMIHSPT